MRSMEGYIPLSVNVLDRNGGVGAEVDHPLPFAVDPVARQLRSYGPGTGHRLLDVPGMESGPLVTFQSGERSSEASDERVVPQISSVIWVNAMASRRIRLMSHL